METPDQILENALKQAKESISKPIISDPEILGRVVYVVRCLSNRAGVRMLMTCALAKLHRPLVDIRKPYTEIGGLDTFSGRAEYDEKYIGPFVLEHDFPVNSTTAFLTPGFRTINVPLAPPLVISGRPKKMYEDTIQLLDSVYQKRITAKDLLEETIRQLLLLKHEQETRLQQLTRELGTSYTSVPLSSEEIVTLISQHLSSPKSSRLPVLIVAAAYQVASQQLGEQAKPLFPHNAADFQTGALGDLEITLVGDNKVVTSYEMKAKEVTKVDIDLAVQKIAGSKLRIDNYIFITTGRIDVDVAEYAASFYRDTGGIELVILDCVGFLRHFLHMFHRLRLNFLEAYQELVLLEPDSAVSQPLKEVFLALRRAAEFDSV